MADGTGVRKAPVVSRRACYGGRVSVATTWAALVAVAAGVALHLAGRRRAVRRVRAVARAFETLPARIPATDMRLQRLIEQARILQLLLAGQLRRLGDLGAGPVTTWRAAMDYDQALEGARRALWEFVLAVYALPRDLKLALDRAGFQPRPLERLVLEPGVFERTQDPYGTGALPRRPAADVVCAGLERARAQLVRFERAARAAARPFYR